MSMHTTAASLRGFLVAAAFTLTAGVFGSACGPKYPNCEEDGDCKAGEFCVNQLCQQCRSSSDCGTGQQCSGGACTNIPGYCDESNPCGAGETCEANRCRVAETRAPEPPPPAEGPCQLNAVYFGFDSSNLESSAREAIAKNADCMRQRGMSGVRVTGYTDPRGTEEYNLALGDRRSRSVQQYMTSLGVDSRALSTSSVGEEMARGEDESGWAQDRRVEFTQK
jgi:peptidoglycan-associated lipoprotein